MKKLLIVAIPLAFWLGWVISIWCTPAQFLFEIQP